VSSGEIRLSCVRRKGLAASETEPASCTSLSIHANSERRAEAQHALVDGMPRTTAIDPSYKQCLSVKPQLELVRLSGCWEQEEHSGIMRAGAQNHNSLTLRNRIGGSIEDCLIALGSLGARGVKISG
jgi:hypothetical protein